MVDNRHRQSVRGSIVDYVHLDDAAYGAAMMAEAESEKRRKDMESSGQKLQDIVIAGWDSRGMCMRTYLLAVLVICRSKAPFLTVSKLIILVYSRG